MDNKQIEEADIKNIEKLIEWSENYELNLSELFLQDEQVTKSLKKLLSLAQLFLSVKGAPKKKDFEYFLTEKHAEQYIGTKDCMIDDFNKWVEDLGVDELIEYANKFNNLCHDEFTAWLVGRMEGIEDKLIEVAKQNLDGKTSEHLAYIGLFNYQTQAIKTMILEGK